MKMLIAGLAAASALFAVAPTADAQPYGHGYGHFRHGYEGRYDGPRRYYGAYGPRRHYGYGPRCFFRHGREICVRR